MNRLIQIINDLQEYNRKYNFNSINLPEIIVLGAQSSGKSSVMERIIGRDILPKNSVLATRCPITLQMINQDVTDESEQHDIKGIFMNEPNKPVYGENDIITRLQELIDQLKNEEKGISENSIIVKLYSSTIPTLTLIDLPGTIKNDGELPEGSSKVLRNLNESYAKRPFSIILAISPANVDFANSDSISIATKYDPEGTRTFHVLTKVDIMDNGTSVRDLLKSKFISKSVGNICVINRSQQNVQNRQSMEVAKDAEKTYLQDHYRDIAEEHGIDALTEVLVKKLKDNILNHLPYMTNEIDERMQKVEEKLAYIDVIKDEKILLTNIVDFISTYTNLIKGNDDVKIEKCSGGAIISDLLYNEYDHEMRQKSVRYLTKNNIINARKNSCGNRKTSFSIEKAFRVLIIKEIAEFEGSSIKCVNRVRDTLIEFVTDVINELNISHLPNFTEKLETEMNAFIHERYLKTKKVIQDIIRCEVNDVFCNHPNSHFFESLNDNNAGKKEKKKITLFNDVLKQVNETIEDKLKPQFRDILSAAYSQNKFDKIKETITKDNCTPQVILNIITELGIPAIDDNTLEELSNDEIGFINIIEMTENLKKTNIDQVDIESELDIDIIEKMVTEYFDEVRNNVIHNVPKWIQTLLIYDLLDDIKTRLFNIIEGDDEKLLELDSQFGNISLITNELEDLKKIRKYLWDIRREKY